MLCDFLAQLLMDADATFQPLMCFCLAGSHISKANSFSSQLLPDWNNIFSAYLSYFPNFNLQSVSTRSGSSTEPEVAGQLNQTCGGYWQKKTFNLEQTITFD